MFCWHSILSSSLVKCMSLAKNAEMHEVGVMLSCRPKLQLRSQLASDTGLCLWARVTLANLLKNELVMLCLSCFVLAGVCVQDNFVIYCKLGLRNLIFHSNLSPLSKICKVLFQRRVANLKVIFLEFKCPFIYV